MSKSIDNVTFMVFVVKWIFAFFHKQIKLHSCEPVKEDSFTDKK